MNDYHNNCEIVALVLLGKDLACVCVRVFVCVCARLSVRVCVCVKC